MRRWTTTWCALAACGALFAAPLEARAASPYLEVPPEEEAVVAPSFRYANMTNEDALAELDRRGIPYAKQPATPGVRAPVRLTGKLHDVWIHSSLNEEERKTSVFEVLDARLALALDDFAVILARHDVVELVHYTMYRPNVPPPGSAAAVAASQDQATKQKPGRAKGKRRASLDGKAAKGPKAPRRPGGDTRRKEAAELAPSGELHLSPAPLRLPASLVLPSALVLPGALVLTGSLVLPASSPALQAEPGAWERSGLPASELPLEVAPSLAKSGKPAGKPSGKGPGKAADRGAPRKQAKKRVLLTTNEKPHGKWAPPGTRHPAGLAIDVGSFRKRDGSVLSVAQHFKGKLGAKTCGDDVPLADTAEARELRSIVCEAREAGVFTYALTPNFDAAHADHFHMEIKPAVKWILFH